MDLFSNAGAALPNLLPYDGTVEYHGVVTAPSAADLHLDALLRDIAWNHDEAVIFGKRIITKRKVAWCADEAFSYTYSKTTKTAVAWPDVVSKLREIVEHTTGERFNSCLLNLYHTGEEGMSWHSDAEKDLVENGTIASMSFGAERRFLFKHKKTGEKVSTTLAHGSLLVMKGVTQTHWLHCIPKSKRITSPRVNLTFRQIRSVPR